LGDTEDKTLDDSLKYTLGYGPAHLAALYQFGSRGFVPERAESVDVGLDYAGLSVESSVGTRIWCHFGGVSDGRAEHRRTRHAGGNGV